MPFQIFHHISQLFNHLNFPLVFILLPCQLYFSYFHYSTLFAHYLRIYIQLKLNKYPRKDMQSEPTSQILRRSTIAQQVSSKLPLWLFQFSLHLFRYLMVFIPDLQQINHLPELRPISTQHLPPNFWCPAWSMRPRMKDRPKIGSWAFHTLQNYAVLLSIFPLGKLKIQAFEGQNRQSIINEKLCMGANDSDIKGVVNSSCIPIKQLVAWSSFRCGRKLYFNLNVRHVLTPFITWGYSSQTFDFLQLFDDGLRLLIRGCPQKLSQSVTALSL